MSTLIRYPQPQFQGLLAPPRSRFLRPPAVPAGGGGTTPPTAVVTADLAEGTATRSFGAVTTQPGDWLVVELIAESNTATETYTPVLAGLTFTSWNDNGTGSGDVRVRQWTAPDAAGGSRTVQITVTGSLNYRAHLTVVRGSTGPGTGIAVSAAAQAVSTARQGDRSMMFMTVGDFSTTPTIASATWTPGGASISVTDGTAADYAFGRWDDSGPAATASHGIATPALNTPSVAVLEMLGTAGGGTTPPPVPPLISSDPDGTALAWQRVPVPTVLRSPAVPAASGDVTGAVTASATVVATAVNPPALPVLSSDPDGTWLTWQRTRTQVLRSPAGPPPASGDVTGAVTASATVTAVASRTTWGSSAVTWGGTAVQWGTPVPSRVPLLSSDAEGTWLAWQRAGSQFVRPVATPVSTGAVTGTVTAGATVTASGIDPPVRPQVWSDATAAYRQQVRTEPTAVVVGAIPVTAPADVTGTVTASATVVATAVSPAVRAAVWSDATTAYRAAIWTPPTTVVATRVPAVPGVGNVTGTVTASATVSATAVNPPVRTVIWSDATSVYRNAVRTEPSAFVFSQVEPPAPGTGDVTGTVTASATVTGSAVNPPVQRSYVASDPGGAWQAQAQFRPATVIRSAPVAPPGTGDVTGTVTASATVVATAVNRAPLPVISSDPAGAHRAFLSSSTIYVRGRVPPPSAGDVTGTVTASASVAAVASNPAPAPLVVSDPGGARQAYLSTRTIYVRGRVAPLAAGAVTGAVTASALVTGQVNSPAAVVGVVTASALVTATETGGTFYPVGVLTATTAPTSTLTAASEQLGVLKATTQRTGGPT